jgi:hypothetical protein
MCGTRHSNDGKVKADDRLSTNALKNAPVIHHFAAL